MAFKSGSQWRLLWAGRGLADRKKSSVHYATEWDGVMCDIEKAFYHHVLSSVRRVWALDIKWRVESESQTDLRCSKKWASAEEMVCREGLRHPEVVTLYIVSVSYQQRDWVQKCSTCEGPQAPRGRGGGALWEEAPCRCVFPLSVSQWELGWESLGADRLIVDLQLMRDTNISEFIHDVFMVMTDFPLLCKHKSGKTVKTTTCLSFDATMFILRWS